MTTLAAWRYSVATFISISLVLGVFGLRAQQTDQVYKQGDAGVLAPKVTHKVDAKYGPNAEAHGVLGDVTLSFEIDKEGKPRNIKVVTALDPELDENAVAAINEWRFDPATKDGLPVVYAVKVQVTFRLQ